jgi:hypothetical protein
MNEIDFKEQLEIKVMTLSQNIWENRVDGKNLSEWLGNFSQNDDIRLCEQTTALYLLSNFMYFGTREIRELLKALYRDNFLKPLVQNIRKDNGNTKEFSDITTQLKIELQATRFLGIGNPSESGTHLLYFFRQENGLGKDDFMHSHDIISINRNPDTKAVDISLKNPEIKRYIFLDDVCGSGTQAIDYSKKLIEEMKTLNPDIVVCYFTLFSTAKGMENIREKTVFDEVDCIFELDDSFKCFSDSARQFRNEEKLDISKAFAEEFCSRYGLGLGYKDNEHALGYKDSQLLIGFAHNTPDNTLPIIWGEDAGWVPIFKRYHKYYGTTY